MWSLLLYEVSVPFVSIWWCSANGGRRCAIDRFIKSPKCYACGAATSGIFNKAEKILAKLEAKNKKRREDKGIVEEEEVGDGGIEFGGGGEEEEEEEEGGARVSEGEED
jgi:RING finger protein 113A